jgi:hypothetical protein
MRLLIMPAIPGCETRSGVGDPGYRVSRQSLCSDRIAEAPRAREAYEAGFRKGQRPFDVDSPKAASSASRRASGATEPMGGHPAARRSQWGFICEPGISVGAKTVTKISICLSLAHKTAPQPNRRKLEKPRAIRIPPRGRRRPFEYPCNFVTASRVRPFRPIQHRRMDERSEQFEPPPLAIDYASPLLHRRFSAECRAATGMLGLATVIYAIACAGSYSRSLWPPPPRFIEAPPWLWLFAIPIFTLMAPKGRFSVVALTMYALLTAVIDAATFPFDNMNPHVSMGIDLWIANCFATIPLHLAITAIIAPVSRALYWLAEIGPDSTEAPPSRWRRRAKIAVPVGMILMACAFIVVYTSLAVAHDNAVGARMADAAWARNGAAIVTMQTDVGHSVGGYDFDSCFDADSGLPFEESWYRLWEPGYNAEITRLLQQHGVPSWSHKSSLVSDSDLIAMLTATDMKRVSNFPRCLSPNLCLMWNGGITPWGDSYGGAGVSIAARNQDPEVIPSFGGTSDPVFVGQRARYPGVIFVRNGKSVAACALDGWVIQVFTDNR